MIITKMALPRRTFLRGMGVTLALPLLDAMVPALSAIAKTAANPVRRLGCIYIPNGANMANWTPAADSPTFELSPTLRPLESVREYVTVVSGLDNKPAEAMGDGAGDHPRAPSAWLNASHPKKTEGADLRAGMTIDQIVAKELGGQTQLASLELAMEPSDLVGVCGASGYSCVYTDTIAWRTATSPLPMENNPRNVFRRMFGDGSSADRVAQMREDRSILDSVTREMAGFQKALGPGDRGRVAEYLDAVRDVERRIQKAEEQSSALTLSLPDRPIGIPDSFEEHIKLMFDLQALAYQADVTRVITFLLGREVSQRTYPQIGVPDAHHAISHHQNNPERHAKVAKIDEYHVKMLADYCDKLRSTPDGDGCLLDHVTVMYGGGISDANSHSHNSLPIVLVGHGADRIKGGRHLHYKDTPMANLLVSLVDKMGVPIERIGDSTGALKNLSGV